MMSILIKGMKMPKNCDECNFSLDCPHDQHQDGYKMIGSRPNSCPMVEVPTPHGRLIDTDMLKDKMLEYFGDSTRLCEEIRALFCTAPIIIENECK